MASSNFGTDGFQRADYLLLGVILLVFLVRLWLLLVSPLGPGVDEAQYWLWSQTPGLGYYSKPPLIAWLIALSHGLFGHQAFAIRLPALVLQTGIVLLIWQAARQLFDAASGRWAALFWLFLPAAGLGSFVISTDTPLLFCWLAGLVLLLAARSALTGSALFFLAGIALGAGMLAKYAAIWFLAGLALWLLIDGGAYSSSAYRRASWAGRGRAAGLFLAGFLLAASPTIIWNLSNQAMTVRHLAQNANYGGAAGGIDSLLAFWSSQFGVFGPVLLAVALLGLLFGRQRLFLACFSLPVLAAISVQAFASEANANWAVTAGPALVLAAAGLVGNAGRAGRASPWRFAGLASLAVNFCLAALLSAVLAAGSLGPLPIASDPLRRLRGWEQLASDVSVQLDRHDIRTILADRRDAAALLGWYLYPRNIAIEIWDRDGRPSNHYEMAFPFGPASQLPVLALSAADGKTDDLPAGPGWQGPVARSEVWTSERRQRQRDFYVAKSWAGQ